MKLYLIAGAAFLLSLAASAAAVVLLTEPAPQSDESVTNEAVVDSSAQTEDTVTTAHSADADTSESSEDSTLVAREPANVDTSHEVDQATDSAETERPSASQRTGSPRSRWLRRRSVGLEDTRTERVIQPKPIEPVAATLADDRAQQTPTIPPESLEVRRQESAQQIARIMSAMKPDEAAAVLKHMSDQEVVDIMRHLNTRKAAGVLAGLSETRAAAISRRLLLSCEGCGGTSP